MTTMLEAIRTNIEKHVTLTESEFHLFASILQHRRLAKRASLLVAGQICDFQGYVVKGCLRVYHTDESGADHVLHFAPEDWWVTDVGSLIFQTPAVLSMDALEPTDVLLIDRSGMERLFADVPKFERLFRIMSQRALVTMQARVMGMLRETADVRYLDFKQRYPDLERRVPQHQIAAYLGISPEFLSRIRHKDRLAGGQMVVQPGIDSRFTAPRHRAS